MILFRDKIVNATPPGVDWDIASRKQNDRESEKARAMRREPLTLPGVIVDPSNAMALTCERAP